MEGVQPVHQHRRGLRWSEILAVLVHEHQVASRCTGLNKAYLSLCAGYFPVPADADRRCAMTYPFGVTGDGGGVSADPAGDRPVFINAGKQVYHFKLLKRFKRQADIAIPR